MVNTFDMEAVHDLFKILRNLKLIGLAMKETEYKKEEIANLGEEIIELADKGLDALTLF